MATQLAGVAYAALPRTAQAKYRSLLAQPPKLIVIHDTSNDATKEQEARYAATRTDPSKDWTSAHFYVDTGGVLGSVPLSYEAWAAYGYANDNGVHIEMCGYNAGMPHAVPAATIANTAVLVRQLCELFGIPMAKLSPADVANGKRGICGHRDITIGLGVGTHDDPGPAFDWPAFIAAVKEDDMTVQELLGALLGKSGPTVGVALQDGYATSKAAAADAKAAREGVTALEAKVAELEQKIAELATPTVTVEIDAGTVQAIAKAVVDEEHARLAD